MNGQNKYRPSADSPLSIADQRDLSFVNYTNKTTAVVFYNDSFVKKIISLRFPTWLVGIFLGHHRRQLKIPVIPRTRCVRVCPLAQIRRARVKTFVKRQIRNVKADVFIMLFLCIFRESWTVTVIYCIFVLPERIYFVVVMFFFRKFRK